jgi:hypothetical protein
MFDVSCALTTSAAKLPTHNTYFLLQYIDNTTCCEIKTAFECSFLMAHKDPETDIASCPLWQYFGLFGVAAGDLQGRNDVMMKPR